MSSKRKRKDDPQKSTRLCETCRSMTSTLQGLQGLMSEEGYEHLDIKMMAESTKQGCSLCTILRSFRRRAENYGHTRVYAELENSSLEGRSTEIGNIFGGGRIKHLLINTLPGLPSHSSFGYKMLAFTTSDDPAAQFLDVRPLSVPVMGSTTIKLIKERLVECQEKHKFCPSANTPSLPKRVVEVRAHDSTTSLSLHLSQPNEKALYVALSYCWGGPQDITTTAATLQSYTISLPTELLSQTMQDAIMITQNLDIRYLWIDALCIVQDDQVDKLTEISAMGMVYKNATFTIAAASASSAKDGFLQDRPPPSMCRLPLYLPGNEYGNIWLRKPSQEHAKEPLDLRGWALQESLLSPRILYYATKDLIWKCQTHNFVAINETYNPYYTETAKRLPNDIFGTSQKAGTLSQQSRTWRKIIEDYSGRKLSVLEDRLPALAGIAGELQKVWKDDYLAGMWRKCLVRHLGWWSSHSNDTTPTMAYKSPGWSWVSCNGQVWLSEISNEEAEVLDVAVTLVDETYPLGPVCNGRIVLRAPILQNDGKRPPGFCNMDAGPDGLRVIDMDTIFLLLGYSAQKIAIDLIISPLGDGTFIRIGHIIGWHLNGALPWSSDRVEREILTIV